MFFQPVQELQGWRGPEFDGLPDQTKLQQEFLQLARWKRGGRPVGNSQYYLSMVASRRWPELSGRCLAGRFFVTVLPDGRATPCCILPFDGPSVRVSPRLPGGALPRHPQLHVSACGGCTISPYVESHLLLSLNWRSVWGALKI